MRVWRKLNGQPRGVDSSESKWETPDRMMAQVKIWSVHDGDVMRVFKHTGIAVACYLDIKDYDGKH